MMNITRANRSLYQINQEWNTYNFNSPIQRGKVWTPTQKSLLVHSVLTGVDIPKIYVYDEDGIKFVLDGKQRMNTLYEFINDGFALNADTPPIDGEDFVGKKYSELPEKMQRDFDAFMLDIIQYEDLTDEERDELFVRYNGGKPLTTMELNKALVGSTILNEVEPLRQSKWLRQAIGGAKGVEKAKDYYHIWQFVMLFTSDFKGLDIGAGAVRKYSKGIKDTGVGEETISNVKSILDYMDKAFPDKLNADMNKQVEIPMIFVAAAYAMKRGVEAKKFGGYMQEFFERNGAKSAYAATKTGGTAKKSSVDERISIIVDDMEQYIESARDYVKFVPKETQKRGRKPRNIDQQSA